MTNREYVNQMTDEELARWAVDMGSLCRDCHDIDDSYCDDGKGTCLKRWLGKKNTDEEAFYNIVNEAVAILDEVKEKFPDTKITLELPQGKGGTVRLADANIYVGMNNDLVIDAE